MNPLYKQYSEGFQQAAQRPNIDPATQSLIEQARMKMRQITNPQQYILNAFQGIPAEIQNNPDQILQYLMQNNRLSPIQMAAISLSQNGGRL